MITHSETVSLPIEKVWEHFLYKIDHPEHFVPGVSNVIIRERSADQVIRAMDITSPAGDTSTVVEKITWQPYVVKFEIIDHRLYVGHVINVAEKISSGETRITFTMFWNSKQTGEPFPHQEVIRNAVLKTVEFMRE